MLQALPNILTAQVNVVLFAERCVIFVNISPIYNSKAFPKH